jgi:hypothetical protein
MGSWPARFLALICAVAAAVSGSLPWPILAAQLRAQGDGHGVANVRCLYDSHGELVERQLDTNGDGRPDVAEYYRDGALLRRDSDRDFNGVTDLVEDFDATTEQRVRSIVDEDYDGTADLLVLFRDGKAVVSERAPVSSGRPAGAAPTGASTALVALRNPFSGHSALDAPLPPNQRDPWIGRASSSGLLVSGASRSGPAPSLTPPTLPFHGLLAAVLSVRSPRGPPLL